MCSARDQGLLLEPLACQSRVDIEHDVHGRPANRDFLAICEIVVGLVQSCSDRLYGLPGHEDAAVIYHRRSACLTLCSSLRFITVARERAMSTTAQEIAKPERVAADAFEVMPTGAALGATVNGVDLRHLSEATFARIMQAWHEHSVLLFRGQTLTDQELIAFSRRLGDLDWAPVQETGRRFVEGLPEIYIVSNVKVNGEPIGSLGDGEAVWHTDMSYLDLPPKASMLYALEIPPTGGNTSFCTMYGIYEALPQMLKDRVAGLKIKHDGTYNSGGYVRQGVTPTDDPIASPGAVHPLVCTHPANGRRMLYLGRRRNAYLVGLELAESEALLNELWSVVDRRDLSWEHVWRVGDLVLWDNRCTMHRRDAFDPNSRRIMHRTQVKGDPRPV